MCKEISDEDSFYIFNDPQELFEYYCIECGDKEIFQEVIIEHSEEEARTGFPRMPCYYCYDRFGNETMVFKKSFYNPEDIKMFNDVRRRNGITNIFSNVP